MDKKTLIETGLFIDNEYLDKMLKIIENPDVSGKVERHHILPKSVGGTDSDDNLIDISVKQHFYVHYYLTLCSTGKLKMKMNFAFKMMAFTRDEWKSIGEDVIEGVADYYAKMVEAGCFKNNYERTDEVKNKISKTLKERSLTVKCKWVNNGEAEKFIPEEEASNLLSQGWFKGRLKLSDDVKLRIGEASKKAHEIKKKKDEESGYIPLKNLHGTRYHRMTNEEKVEVFKKYVKEGYKNHKVMVSLDGKSFVLMSYFDIKESGLDYLPKYAFI